MFGQILRIKDKSIKKAGGRIVGFAKSPKLSDPRGFLLSPREKGNGNHQYLVLVEMIAESREINLLQIQKR
jgi:hypothetical protein